MTKIFFTFSDDKNPFFLWFFLTSTPSICKNATAVEYAEMQRKRNCERVLSSVSASFIRLLCILLYPQFFLLGQAPRKPEFPYVSVSMYKQADLINKNTHKKNLFICVITCLL